MSKTTKVLFLVAVGGLMIGTARADVLYTFNTTSMSATPGTQPAGGIPLSVTMDLTDAQVASGSFSIANPGGNNGPNPIYTGDVSGFSSITIHGELISPSYIYGEIAAFFLFNPSGGISSTSLLYLGNSESGQLLGTGSVASGYVGSDRATCGTGFAFISNPPAGVSLCSVSGVWTETAVEPSSVPEPATVALLGAGMLGLVMGRRQRAA